MIGDGFAMHLLTHYPFLRRLILPVVGVMMLMVVGTSACQ